MIALHLHDLAVRRGEQRLFRGLDLSTGPGQAVAMTGANGAGKSSLLRVIAGLLRPETGTIQFEQGGVAMEADQARRRHLHLIGHLDGFRSGRTARDELAFQVEWCGGDRGAIDSAALALGLTALLDTEVRRLSAGQRRRLALARLLAVPRAIWLLDEPLSPLDGRWRSAVGTLMQDHMATGGLILAAVHDPLPIPARTVEIGGGA